MQTEHHASLIVETHKASDDQLLPTYKQPTIRTYSESELLELLGPVRTGNSPGTNDYLDDFGFPQF